MALVHSHCCWAVTTGPHLQNPSIFPNRNSVPFPSRLPLSPRPGPWQPLILLSASINLTRLSPSCEWSQTLLSLRDWPFHATRRFAQHVVTGWVTSIVCGDHVLLLFLSVDTWAASASDLLWATLLRIRSHEYVLETRLSTLMGVYPEVELPDHLKTAIF